MKLLPVAACRHTVRSFKLPSFREFPNSSLHHLPLIVYRPFEVASDEDVDPSSVEDLLSKNGLEPAWRYGMFPFDHYHSNTHEVLVTYMGTAELAFGHSDSPDVVHHSARPGDVYIVPAGVVHRSLQSSSDFKMVGSYPVGSHDWDNCRGTEDPDRREAQWERVRELGCSKDLRLRLDPVYGSAEGSPLSELWWSESLSAATRQGF